MVERKCRERVRSMEGVWNLNVKLQQAMGYTALGIQMKTIKKCSGAHWNKNCNLIPDWFP